MNHTFTYTGPSKNKNKIVDYLESTPGIVIYATHSVWPASVALVNPRTMKFNIECKSVEDETVFRLMFP